MFKRALPLLCLTLGLSAYGQPVLSPSPFMEGLLMANTAEEVKSRLSLMGTNFYSYTTNIFHNTNYLGVFNVKDFGAVGDGVTDNKSAIQATINVAATNGGTVYFPSGDFRVSGTLYLSNNVAFAGDGYGQSKVRMTDAAADGTPILHNGWLTNTTIRDIMLDGNWRNRGISPNNSENCGLYLRYSTNTVIERVYFYSMGKDGVNFDDSDHALIRTCIFDDCGASGLSTHGRDVQVIGCVFTNIGWRNQFTGPHPGAIGDVGSQRLVIVGNTFSSNFIHIHINGSAGYTVANNVCSQFDATHTNVLVQGSSVGEWVGNTFSGGFGMRLMGSPQGLQISGNTFATAKGMRIDGAEHVVISGNSFRNTHLAGAAEGIGINTMTASRVAILDNQFHVATQAIVGNSSTVSGLLVKGNVTTGGTGIAFTTSSSNHRIMNNVFNATDGSSSLNLAYGTNNFVSGNFFANYIYLYASNNVISDNVIKGVYLGANTCRSNVFANNVVTGNITANTGGESYALMNFWFNNRGMNGGTAPLSVVNVLQNVFPDALYGANLGLYNFHIVLNQLDFIPTNAIPTAGGTGITNWTLCNLTNTIGGGGPTFVATNRNAANSFLLSRPTQTVVAWP